MTVTSLFPPGQPLPPNRRVKRRKAPPGNVEAPEERVLLGPELDDDDDYLDQPRPGISRARVWEALRLTAGVLVTVGAALLCVWGLVRYTRTSPRFSVKTVQVQGSSHRSPEDIARAGGIAPEQNIFATDLEVAEARLLGDPWIERVSLRRKLPATIMVDVVEREAHALVAIGADLYVATRQGELFKKYETGDPYDLPVVSGIRAEEVAEDRAAAVALIRRALDLVADYDHTAPAKSHPVQEAHLEDDGAIVLVVGKDATALHLGRGPFRQSLEQASRVLAEIQNRRGQASVVFLDNDAHPERVVVRMR
ncbi:MAG TPA: FtsQ-type POTRA domain-containing protein [Polyangiaceae bacterium]|nr:FtsQ-type POTRA domain-containing protein [Polyangiaceae bacterium]